MGGPQTLMTHVLIIRRQGSAEGRPGEDTGRRRPSLSQGAWEEAHPVDTFILDFFPLEL